MVTATENNQLSIRVSPDKLEAFFVPCSEDDYTKLTEKDLLAAITQAHIKITPPVQERAAKLMELIRSNVTFEEPFLISTGFPPVAISDQEFIPDEKYSGVNRTVDDKRSINVYEQRKLVTVTSGSVIGTIRTAQTGRDGCDVFGNPLKPKATPTQIRLGENVALGPDGTTVRATAEGQVTFAHGMLSVRRFLEVNGDIDFNTGNVEAATDVTIHGSVRDLFIVRSKGNITVSGMVEAARLFADGDITVTGGVKGRQKAILEAKGNIQAKFLNFVYLMVGGNIEVTKESIDSTLICDGWLDLSHGSLIGGHAFGLKGAKLKIIGSASAVKTVVGAGLNPLSYRRVLEIDESLVKDKELVVKIRTTVEPLMRCLKRLTAEQREKATELLCHAESLDTAIREKEQERKDILALFPPPTEVELHVATKIFPNTLILVGDRFATIKEEINGPIKFQIRQEQGPKELLLINQLTGSTRSLVCGRLDLKVLDIPDRPEISQGNSSAGNPTEN